MAKRRRKKSRKLGSGAQKGAAFERKVCKHLSFWATDLVRNDVFWRTPGSGARATSRWRRYQDELADQIGDVQAVRSEGEFLTRRFVIELKHRKDANLVGWLTGQHKQIREWWAKVNEESGRVSRWPMLIAKRDRVPTLLVVDYRGRELLDRASDGDLFRLEIVREGAHVCLFDEFLEAVDPNVVRSFSGRRRLRGRRR